RGWDGRGPVRVVMVANFVPKKGHAVALEALARVRRRVPEVELWLGGGGELRPPIEAQVQGRGLEAGGAVARAGAPPPEGRERQGRAPVSAAEPHRARRQPGGAADGADRGPGDRPAGALDRPRLYPRGRRRRRERAAGARGRCRGAGRELAGAVGAARELA